MSGGAYTGQAVPAAPDLETDLDAVTGQVFATPAGKRWLDLNAGRHPQAVSEIRERVARMRRRWSGR